MLNAAEVAILLCFKFVTDTAAFLTIDYTSTWLIGQPPSALLIQKAHFKVTLIVTSIISGIINLGKSLVSVPLGTTLSKRWRSMLL